MTMNMGVKKRVDGAWVDAPDCVRKLGTATDTITTLPADIYADGTNATVGLVGNGQQTGTPTPDNPVMPEFVGVRTGNILQNVLSGTEVNGVTFTVNADKSITVNGRMTTESNAYVTIGTVSFESGEKYTIDGVYGYTSSTLQLFTQSLSSFTIGNRLQSYNGYVTRTAAASEKCDIRLYVYANTAYDNVTVYPQIVKGDSASPYEPYGYKIPITCAGQTVPVYLGQTPTIRRIKKFVLKGTEKWYINDSISTEDTAYFYTTSFKYGIYIPGYSVCSHFEYKNVFDIRDANGYHLLTGYDGLRFRIMRTIAGTLAEFKSYLADQYADGAPVTVWYVLKEPEIATENEPLAKIRDYSDTVSGVSIPTIIGKSTFDVQTTLKPSEVQLNYTGWHPAVVHERINGAWVAKS